MSYSMTNYQKLVYEYLVRNLPETIVENEDMQVFLKLIAIVFGDEREKDDILKDLISPDRIPAEYLPDLSYLLGYNYDKFVSEDQQRLYISHYLSNRKIRGTPLSVRIVASSFGQDVESYLQNTSAGNIQIIEYGVNDQDYTPQIDEIWEPGCIALITYINLDIAREKIMEIMPAGRRLSAIKGLMEIYVIAQPVIVTMEEDVETLSEVAFKMYPMTYIHAYKVSDLYPYKVGDDIFSVNEVTLDIQEEWL